jgi:hypothetical protein
MVKEITCYDNTRKVISALIKHSIGPTAEPVQSTLHTQFLQDRFKYFVIYLMWCTPLGSYNQNSVCISLCPMSDTRINTVMYSILVRKLAHSTPHPLQFYV